MRVVVVGGGIMGAAAAWWLTRGATPPAVTVIERDPTLQGSATMRSAASIRQQFSQPHNVRASAFGWEFLTRADAVLGEDVALRRRGYLILADDAGAGALEADVAMQREEGAETVLLDPARIAARFPWLSTDGIAAGALGRDEGWFDPAALHRGFRRGAIAAGAAWVTGEARGFDFAGGIRGVRLADDRTIPCDVVVNAAGPRAGIVAGWAGIALPVRPDIRTVFHLTAPAAGRIAAESPLIADPSGVWMRPEGAGFIAGAASDRQPADPWAFPIDWDLFEARIWPALAARIPAFERLRVAGAWAGPYDWNEAGQDALLGADPACPTLIHVTGFSGHGLQHAPAMGRAVAELVLTGGFVTLDFQALRVTRLRDGAAPTERAVI